MADINEIVVHNILNLMTKNTIKQFELADAIGVSKQTMSKMLNGSRLINVSELKLISKFFNVSVDELVKENIETDEINVIRAFMGKVNSDTARKALQTIDELADMIIFHADVKENAKEMSKTWEM